MSLLSYINFDENGLVPALIQDYYTSAVLMLAYMNEESILETMRLGKTVFFSRSRNKLWLKGEDSGRVQLVKEIDIDCDGDALLIKVQQVGAACHTEHYSCFYRTFGTEGFVRERAAGTENYIGGVIRYIESLMDNGIENPSEKSYYSYLFDGGNDEILKKLASAATEAIISAKNDSQNQLRCKAADLLFCLVAVLKNQGLCFQDTLDELQRRM